jgi:hypothetical protein
MDTGKLPEMAQCRKLVVSLVAQRGSRWHLILKVADS